MSIDLPRSHRPLHFTGSVKALAPERPANALGQERPKGPLPSSAPPALGGHASASPAADVYLVEAQPTPYMASRPSERAEKVAKAVKLTTMRGQLASIDDDLVTQALDRDEIDAALFPVAKRENAAAPAPNLPVPGFRSVKEVQQHQAQPTVIIQAQKGGGSLPLGAWLAVALIAAVVSFNLAPQAAESVAEAVRALEAR